MCLVRNTAAPEGAVLPSPPPDADQRRHRFEAMYAAYHGPVLGYVLRRTENPDDAADVIADTFLTAWRRLEDLPPEPAARLWLYGVARPVLANHHRGQRRPVTRISPVSDAEAARMARPDTLADLAGQITATPPAAPGRRTASRGHWRSIGKGRWWIGIPVAAGLAVALLVVTSLGRPPRRRCRSAGTAAGSPSSCATRWPTRPVTGPSSPSTTCASRCGWCRRRRRWSAPWST
jgi:Sigma-70 region 2